VREGGDNFPAHQGSRGWSITHLSFPTCPFQAVRKFPGTHEKGNKIQSRCKQERVKIPNKHRRERRIDFQKCRKSSLCTGKMLYYYNM
jgi:hypothetical protein